MANGFEVNITESEFKAKEPVDQAWILFQGIITANKGISKIEDEGCKFSKDKHSKDKLKMWTAFGGGFAGVLGVIYLIYQMTCK